MTAHATLYGDGRPLSERVRRLAERFEAQATGHDKDARASVQLATNCRRDAHTLREALEVIERG